MSIGFTNYQSKNKQPSTLLTHTQLAFEHMFLVIDIDLWLRSFMLRRARTGRCIGPTFKAIYGNWLEVGKFSRLKPTKQIRTLGLFGGLETILKSKQMSQQPKNYSQVHKITIESHCAKIFQKKFPVIFSVFRSQLERLCCVKTFYL